MGHLHKGNNMYISIGTEIKTFKNLISLRIKYITIIEIYKSLRIILSPFYKSS
jgi:hypothetical protein